MTHTSHNKNHLMNAPVDDAFGFYGTIATNEELNPDEAAKAWADAMLNLMEGPWQANAMLARNFLRSRWGRHFADRASCYAGPTLAAPRLTRASDGGAVRLAAAYLNAVCVTQKSDDPMKKIEEPNFQT